MLSAEFCIKQDEILALLIR